MIATYTKRIAAAQARLDSALAAAGDGPDAEAERKAAQRAFDRENADAWSAHALKRYAEIDPHDEGFGDA